MAYTPGNGTFHNIELSFIKTAAEYVGVVNLTSTLTPTGKLVKASNYAGMNASFFLKQADGYNAILNIAYENKISQGVKGTGMYNRAGNCVLYYTTSSKKLVYKTGITQVVEGDEIYNSTWAQGGGGLYFGETANTFISKNKSAGIDSETLDGNDARTAVLANTSTKSIYFIIAPEQVSIINFRAALIDFLESKEGGYNGWSGLLLDGGHSAQMYIKKEDKFIPASYFAGVVPVPQMIATY